MINESSRKDLKINNNILEKSLNIDEEKYSLKIYPSKDKATIIFKVEPEHIQTFYFYEKFDLRDFEQKNKQFNSTKNIQEAFNCLKLLIEKNLIKLEKKKTKIIITFLNKSEKVAVFPLRKKIFSQNRLNPLFVDQIQENKSIIKKLKNEANNLAKTTQNQNDIINNINAKINTINNNIKNIISDINNINFTIKNSIKKEENGLNIIPRIKEEKVKTNNHKNRKEIKNKNIIKNENENKNFNINGKEEKEIKDESKGENINGLNVIDYNKELRTIEKKIIFYLFLRSLF